MKTPRTLLVACACLAALAVPALALPPVPVGPAAAPPNAVIQSDTPGTEAVTVFGPKKLLDTYMAIGPSTIALTQNAYNTVDTSVVTCPASAVACTIGLESMAQINPAGNDWAICLLVDGISPSCQYQGVPGSVTGLAVGNARGARQNLAPGSHTVQTQVFVQNHVAASVNLYFFHTDYRVYKQ